MFRSLRLRLFFVMLIVVVFFVAATAFFASRLTMDEFQQYLEYNDAAHQQQVNQVLVGLFQSYYAEHRSWGAIQTLIDQLGEVTNARIILVGQDGQIIADTHKEMVGKRIPFSRIKQDAYLLVDNTLVGAILVYGSPWITPSPEPSTTTFVSSVNRSLLLAVLVIGTLALLFALVVAHRIAQPLENLTSAVRSLEKGNLQQRVAVKSSDEIGELAGAFNALGDHLAQLEQMRRSLISDVAHELRTPLSCILGYLEALQDGVASPGPELIASLYEEASLLRRLVVDLQQLALADSGQLKLECRKVRLADLVEQAVGIFQPQAVNSGLKIQVDIPPDLPPVYADAERVGQVLRNLVSNAIAYTPERGEITIAAISYESQIRVSVTDTGIGIDPVHLPHLFDRFYRADRSRNQATGGAGLGLAIVKHLVEAHGGHIWAESDPGKGTTFTFTLPANLNPT